MNRTLYKEMIRTLWQTKGRFLSIMSLTMLSCFALVGLMATPPDVTRSVSQYLERLRVQNLTVLSDYGLSATDQAELRQVAGAEVDFGYFTDVVVGQTPEAWRILSLSDGLAQYDLVAGRLPQAPGEIALLSALADRYQIGDSLDLSEAGRPTPALTQTRFTVTGFVNSGELGNRQLFGQSTVGSGTLAGYGVVTPDNFDQDVYTLARLRYEDLAGLDAFESAYQDRVAQHQAELEALLADNGDARLAEVQTQARDRIAQGQADIDSAQEALASGSSQLASAEAEWQDQSSQLSSAADTLQAQDETLASGQTQLEQAASELADAQATLATGAAALATGRQTLAGQRQVLDDRQAQLTAAKAELDRQATELDAGRALLASGQEQLAQGQAALAQQESQLRDQGIDPETVPDILTARSQLASQASELAVAQEQLNSGQSQWEAGNSQYQTGQAAYESGATQWATGQTALAEEEARYQAGLAAYTEGQARYETQAEALASGQAQVASAQAELASGQEALASARSELDAHQADYDAQVPEAQQAIRDGQARIDRAEDALAGLVTPNYQVVTRQNFPGDSAAFATTMRTRGIRNVGHIFPVVLFLVAALVTLTTMTRFVTEKRLQAGTLRALGYHQHDIVQQFLLYGLLASGLGATLGILAGTYGLPYILGATLFSTTTYPAFTLTFYGELATLALGCSLLTCLLPTYWVARQELREVPAQLLLPKPPASGARILLERWSWLWSRLTFTKKVTARNIFRYKQRMLMTIFGVAGSVALLFAGLGLVSSISGIAERQYDQLLRYDLIVSQQHRLNTTEQEDLTAALSQADIAQTQALHLETLTVKGGTHEAHQTVTLMVAPTGQEDWGGLLDLRDAATRAPLPLAGDTTGVLVTRKLADLLRLAPGDTWTLTNADGQEGQVTVGGIVEMYAGHNVFVSQAAYAQAFGGAVPATNAQLVRLSERTPAALERVAARLMGLTGVRAVIQSTSTRTAIDTTVDSLTLVMQILTGVSILLALVILYNLTTINVAERIRELSTIKVLGFHNREVTRYIYRETIILSLIGIGAGLAGGWLLHRYLLDQVADDTFRFNAQVGWSVYLTPIVAISAIVALLGWQVHRTLRGIDMLAALKSNE